MLTQISESGSCDDAQKTFVLEINLLASTIKTYQKRLSKINLDKFT